MEEEAINYLFDYAVSQGYKKSREDFVKLIQTNDEAFGYAFDYAKKGGYKKDEKDFGVLIGRGAAAPVATTAPAKTEVAIATPVAETKPTVTPEPTKELRSEPMTTVKAQALPEKQVATPTVDMAKMPTMEVRSVEPTPTKEEPMTAEKKEVVKSDIESQLLPVTEKTEVKAIETPSDKMVIKSEAKVEPKPVEEVKPTEVANIQVKEVPAPSDKMVIKSETKVEDEIPNPPFETVKVFNKRKIGGKEIYSGYDKENNKWYIYNKKSKKKEWIELNPTEDKSLLNELNSTLPIEIETIKKVDLKNQDTKIEVPTFRKESIAGAPVISAIPALQSWQTQVQEDVDEKDNLNIVPYEYKPGSYAQMAWNQQKKGFPEAVEDSNDWYESWYKERMKNPDFKDVATDRYNAIKNRQVPFNLEALPSFEERHGEGKLATAYREKVRDPKNKPYENKIYIGNAIYPDEGVNDYYNELFIDPTTIKEYIKKEALHETSHWLENNYPQKGTNRDDIEQDKILNIIMPKEYLNPNNENKLYNLEDFNGMPEKWNKYVSSPTEIRARLERWREFNKISPTKKYSKEEMEKIIDDNIKEMKDELKGTHLNIMELYKLIRKDPKVLQQLNEKLVETDKKQDSKSFDINPFGIDKTKTG